MLLALRIWNQDDHWPVTDQLWGAAWEWGVRKSLSKIRHW